MKKILNLATISLLAIFLFSCAGDDKKPAFNIEGTEWGFINKRNNKLSNSVIFRKDYIHFKMTLVWWEDPQEYTNEYKIYYKYDQDKQILSFTGDIDIIRESSKDKNPIEKLTKQEIVNKDGATKTGFFYSLTIDGVEYTDQNNFPITEKTKVLCIKAHKENRGCMSINRLK